MLHLPMDTEQHNNICTIGYSKLLVKSRAGRLYHCTDVSLSSHKGKLHCTLHSSAAMRVR